ncbi:uncharacterized protein LOC109414279 isoform X2 [Aedes albopictus]|uniref:Secreted protein n=1 Tax=Aedes albopictus TaxID=7160 RepID=A0ABM1Y998_AEDAL|nr:uncharacterized protein LOC109414279 isoform X2 [Aedes albopictus]
MAFNDYAFTGSINFRLTCLAVFVTALLVTLPGSSQAAINDNEAQIDGKIVNQGGGSEQKADGSRSSILDNIFNIPIQTLKAVNDLVQSIAGNLQAAGSGSYFRSKNDLNRNINVNIDDDDKDKKDKH